ncbi:FKBP-type peptidyl-prolyl cis-trans isomerase [Pyrococcus abyssi]|uniref:peptidylprolyl isomerase n=1 Tax=Pyrococcus abyssi (strain GE5 / Orsay) TaxID=272844 RepID=Q9V0N6_PYRAB|nr:peptidylprolyl isomerase [Pyrococcus abyssi]CAB49667.1 slyD FKBP-type peptidyl-prolyl cis-trans isomerase [Pyrococcus abyssi GE5]CCE70149.1 TPA: FKBP-type peptidyl-prolyl cis-trans isomerase (slyD) [Pyrococcus abyssi GE5]
MKVNRGDVIRINYTGRVKETGEIFDTTYEDVAKEAGIYNPKGVYGPVPIAVGAGHVIPGLDKRLIGLEVGKKYTIEVPPEEGFGLRDPKLIKVFTIGQFKKQGIIPFPGLEVEVTTESGRKMKGRIITVSGGRVRVDFNHPLAGKTLVYEVEIVEKIEDPIEKIKALIELRLPMIDKDKLIIEVGEKEVRVEFNDQNIDSRTLILGEILLESDIKFLGYEKVEFKPSIEELLKPKQEQEEQTKETKETKEESAIEKSTEENKPNEE